MPTIRITPDGLRVKSLPSQAPEWIMPPIPAAEAKPPAREIAALTSALAKKDTSTWPYGTLVFVEAPHYSWPAVIQDPSMLQDLDKAEGSQLIYLFMLNPADNQLVRFHETFELAVLGKQFLRPFKELNGAEIRAAMKRGTEADENNFLLALWRAKCQHTSTLSTAAQSK